MSWLSGFLAGFISLRLSAARCVWERLLIIGGVTPGIRLIIVKLLQPRLYAGILTGS